MPTDASLTLATGLTREYLLHHRVCPKSIAPDGALVVAVTADAFLGGTDDIGAAYHRPITLETVARADPERLVERLTTRSERSIELARADTSTDDLATDVRDLANQPPVIRFVNIGRRVWRRAHRDSYCNGTDPVQAPICAGVIERTIYDGDQVLAEIRENSSDLSKARTGGRLHSVLVLREPIILGRYSPRRSGTCGIVVEALTFWREQRHSPRRIISRRSFQISFCLEPMAATRAASYLAALVRPAAPPTWKRSSRGIGRERQRVAKDEQKAS